MVRSSGMLRGAAWEEAVCHRGECGWAEYGEGAAAAGFVMMGRAIAVMQLCGGEGEREDAEMAREELHCHETGAMA